MHSNKAALGLGQATMLNSSQSNYSRVSLAQLHLIACLLDSITFCGRHFIDACYLLR